MIYFGLLGHALLLLVFLTVTFQGHTNALLLENLSHSLKSCCELVNNPMNTALVECVNSSAQSFSTDLLERVKAGEDHRGPVVGMMTRATPDIFNYAEYGFFLQAVHAEQNGYVHLPLLPDPLGDDYSHHRKLTNVLEFLTDDNISYDYIAWIDVDSIFLDLDMRIEELLIEFSEAQILLSADTSSSVNTGFVIFRNSAWSRQFVNNWLNARLQKYPSDHPAALFTDRMGFDHAFSSLHQDQRRHVAILPPDALNSVVPAMATQLPHHKILHLAGESNRMRANVLRSAAQELCAAVQERRELKHQLGLSREVIRSTAEQSYSAMARDLLDKFKKANHTMSDKPENSLLADIEELRRSVRQYKQAIWFGGGGEKVAVEALQLELAAYETITREVDTFHDHIALQARENLRIRSDMFDDTWNTWIDVLRSVETFPLLPQLLLISAEISQELLQFLSDFILVKSNVDMLEEWTEVAYRILKCAEQLSVLLEETDVIFYGEVMNMKASILREMGNMLVDTNGNVAEAVDFFRRSYAVYEELRRYMHSKQHGQLARYDVDAASATYAGLAKALCLNKQHDEGLLRYDIVLDDFARLHNSQFHPSLANLFLGRGLCARDAGQLDDAIRTLDMCLDICRRWPDISFGEIPHHALAVMRHAEAELRTGEL